MNAIDKPWQYIVMSPIAVVLVVIVLLGLDQWLGIRFPYLSWIC